MTNAKELAAKLAAANAEIERLRWDNEWRSVGSPPPVEFVFLTDNGGEPYIGIFCGGEWTDLQLRRREPTNWYPLPLPSPTTDAVTDPA